MLQSLWPHPTICMGSFIVNWHTGHSKSSGTALVNSNHSRQVLEYSAQPPLWVRFRAKLEIISLARRLEKLVPRLFKTKTKPSYSRTRKNPSIFSILWGKKCINKSVYNNRGGGWKRTAQNQSVLSTNWHSAQNRGETRKLEFSKETI